LYDSKLRIAQALLQQWVAAHPAEKLPVVFDSWFTQPDFCRFVADTLHLPYVGTLADDDKVILKTGKQTLKEFADQLKKEHLEALAQGGKAVFQRITISFKGKAETYYSYCCLTDKTRPYASARWRKMCYTWRSQTTWEGETWNMRRACMTRYFRC
jgi:hypothetical protein